MRHLFLAGSILLLGTSVVLAQTPTTPAVSPNTSAAPPVTAPPAIVTPGARTSASVPAADQRFAEIAAQSGVAEVQAAQLAVSKTSNAGVKDFADRMIADHTKANQQLMQIASAEGISLPNTPDTSDAEAFKKLQGLSGGAFNRLYIRTQVQDHVKAVSLFKTESSSGQDQRLKQFAQETLPILQMHLKMARALRDHAGAQG